MSVDKRRLINLRVLRLFGYSFLCAVIFIVFPVTTKTGATNYWAYYMAKEQWWSFFGNAGFVEMAEACLPGAPIALYVYAYIWGWLIPPIVHILAYAFNVPGNFYLNTLAVTTSLIVTTIFYGAWVYLDSNVHFEDRNDAIPIVNNRRWCSTRYVQPPVSTLTIISRHNG